MVEFTKISATGNDFILIDNRKLGLLPEKDFIQRICTRRTGVGADGVLLLEKSESLDFSMRYFNADGSEGELCGNGARAIALFAHLKGLGTNTLKFGTKSGSLEAHLKENSIRVQMPAPREIDLKLPLAEEFGLDSEGFAWVGVPHFVARTKNLDSVDVEKIGRALRYHPHFRQGTNVNFIDYQDKHTLYIRTYERGVEAETLACGTGSTAAAIIGFLKGKLESPVSVKAPGGILTIQFDPELRNIFLEGKVDMIYFGELLTKTDELQ